MGQGAGSTFPLSVNANQASANASSAAIPLNRLRLWLRNCHTIAAVGDVTAP